MISSEERAKRQTAYELTKARFIKRGIELSAENDALMQRFINGDISEKDFFAVFSGLMRDTFQPQVCPS